MKTVISLFCALTLITISKCTFEPDDMKLVEIALVCKNETQINIDELLKDRFDYKKMIRPKSIKVKCMISCILKKLGMITDGKFNKEIAIKLDEEYYVDDKDNLEKAKKVIDICANRVAIIRETEDCILGSIVAECLVIESLNIGLSWAPLG